MKMKQLHDVSHSYLAPLGEIHLCVDNKGQHKIRRGHGKMFVIEEDQSGV